jgi:hypothetical protein
MAWYDSVLDFGKTAFNFVTGNSLASNLAKTALLGFVVNKVNASVNKENVITPPPATIDPGVRLQVEPDTETKIPVLYGQATFGGSISDAFLTADNLNMYFVLTLCEKTGTKLSNSTASAFTFNDVFLNDQRVIFQSDGITVDYTIDREGNQDISARGLIQVYCYAGSSTTPVVPEYYTNPSLQNAYAVMPNWDSTYTMNDLVFAIVKVTYSRDKGVNALPNVLFTITNSMNLPGDCLYDYMTSVRYGAAIPAAEIDV